MTTDAILRPAEAAPYLGVSRSKLYDLEAKDPDFPRKIKFSARCVGWRRASLDSYLEAKESGRTERGAA